MFKRLNLLFSLLVLLGVLLAGFLMGCSQSVVGPDAEQYNEPAITMESDPPPPGPGNGEPTG